MKNFVAGLAGLALVAAAARAQETTSVDLPVEGLEDSAAAAVQAELEAAKVAGVEVSVADETLHLEVAPGATVALSQIQKALASTDKAVAADRLELSGTFEVVANTDDEADYTEGLLSGFLGDGTTVEQVPDARAPAAEKGVVTVFRIDYAPAEGEEAHTWAELQETVASALITPEAEGHTFGLTDLRWNGPSGE